MKLAELNRAIMGVERRLKRDYRRVKDTVMLETHATQGLNGPTVRDLERMLRQLQRLKVNRARTLAAHPEVVDLLARRRALRIQSKMLRDLLSRARATTPSAPPRFDAARLNSEVWLRMQRRKRELAAQRHLQATQERSLKVVPLRRRPTVEVGALQQHSDQVAADLMAVETELERLGWQTEQLM